MDEKFTRKITQDDFITEKNDIIKNHLLGNYDENNEYHISSQIVDELIALEKLKKSSFGNSVFCVGNLLGYGEIVFEVVYSNKTSDTSAQAFLFVLENVDKINGYLQNTIRTQIAHFSSDLEDFIEESYEKFNIVGTLDDEGKVKKNLDEIDLTSSYILAKKAYSLLLDKLEDERVLDAYGKYFTARLAALTKYDNPFTNDVLARFNEEYALIQGVFLQQKNYKTLNELLDKCIEETSGIKEDYLKYEEDFYSLTKKDLDKFIQNMQTIDEKSSGKAIDMLDKGDREKVKEILSSNEKSEKDLSSEELQNGNMIAPLQSMDVLENEIDNIIESENLDVNDFIGKELSGNLVEELESEELEEEFNEEFSEDPNENIQEEIENENIVEENVFDESDFEEKTENINNFEELEEEKEEEESSAEEILALFRSQVQEELDQEEEEENKNNLYEELLDHIEEKSEEIAEKIEENEIEEPQVEEEIENIVEEVAEDKETTNEIVDNLQNDFKENASLSIYDRLEKLKSNMRNSKPNFTKPNKANNEDKLSRVFERLSDRSIDR